MFRVLPRGMVCVLLSGSATGLPGTCFAFLQKLDVWLLHELMISTWSGQCMDNLMHLQILKMWKLCGHVWKHMSKTCGKRMRAKSFPETPLSQYYTKKSCRQSITYIKCVFWNQDNQGILWKLEIFLNQRLSREISGDVPWSGLWAWEAIPYHLWGGGLWPRA